LRKAGITS